MTSRTAAPGANYGAEAEVTVPVYGSGRQGAHYPQPAESRLVYSSQPAPSFSYAQSRPADHSPPPPPPPPLNARSSNPLPAPPAAAQTAPYSPTYSPTYRPPSPTYQAPPDSPKHPLGQPYQLAATMEGSGRRVAAPSTAPAAGAVTSGTEQEVDALTNLLMQNMEAAADPDFFGQSATVAVLSIRCFLSRYFEL